MYACFTVYHGGGGGLLLLLLSLLLQSLRVYEQGKLLSAWQDQLSDAVQAQLQALFQAVSARFLQAAKLKVRSGTRFAYLLWHQCWQHSCVVLQWEQLLTIPAAGRMHACSGLRFIAF